MSSGGHRLSPAYFGANVLCAILLFTASGAWAGARLPCQDLRIFSKAAVNALVLPYRYEKPIAFDPRSAGSRLAALIQQETLFSMLKYGSVGATELVSENGRVCDVREVISRIGREKMLTPGYGLAIIWGRIYEEQQQVFVQSYIRFLRRGEEETIQVDLSGPENQALQFSASLPAQAVAMVPRRLTHKDLAEIERRIADTLVIRKEPRDAAAGKRLYESASEPLTYGVMEAKGDWMRIQSYVTGETGWVRARMDDQAWTLRSFLPELGYLEGVAAYLRLRAASHLPLNDSKRVFGWMRRAFANYERAVGKDAAPEASGIAKSMMGIVQWTQPDATVGGREPAARLFHEAFEQMPDSSEARVLATITAPLLRPSRIIDKDAVADINRGLLGAIAVDPRNLSALTNLERLYEFAGRNTSLAPYQSEELRARLAVVKSARAQSGKK